MAGMSNRRQPPAGFAAAGFAAAGRISESKETFRRQTIRRQTVRRQTSGILYSRQQAGSKGSRHRRGLRPWVPQVRPAERAGSEGSYICRCLGQRKPSNRAPLRGPPIGGQDRDGASHRCPASYTLSRFAGLRPGGKHVTGFSGRFALLQIQFLCHLKGKRENRWH